MGRDAPAGSTPSRSVKNRPSRRSSLRRRAGVGLCAAALVAAGLSGCGGSSSSSGGSSHSAASAKGVVHLTFWEQWGGVYNTDIQNDVAAFNKTHPRIQVSALSVPTDADQKLLTAVAAGKAPNVFQEPNPTLGEYAAKGVLQPLNKYFTGADANTPKWLYPVAAAGGTYDGKMYGYPISMNSFLLFYNKTMMKQAGLNPNDPPKTVDQLDADQAKEWKTSGAHVESIGFYPSDYENYLSAWNVHMASPDGSYQFTNNPQALALMKYIAGYARYPYAAANAFETGLSSKDTDAFTTGKTGFFVQGPWEMTEIAANDPSMKWGVEPMPAPAGGQPDTTVVSGNYLEIPHGTPNAKQAWTFISWFAGYDNEAWAAKELPVGSWLPPSPTIAKFADYRKWLAAEPGRSAFVTVFDNPHDLIDPVTCNEDVFQTEITTVTEALLEKKTTAEGAIKSLQSAVGNKTGC